MKRAFLFSGGITAILVGVFSVAFLTTAAATKFAFKGEATVREHDLAGKNMRVNFTKLSERARPLGLGVSLDVSVGGAKFYKKGSDGKVRRVKQGNIAVGDRVSISGAVKSDDRFVASRVDWVDTGFTMKGTLKTFNRTIRQMTIDVSSSTYKSDRYKGKTVTFTFSEATKFYTQGVGKSMEDVTASDQKVEVRGKEVNTDLEVTYMNENVR